MLYKDDKLMTPAMTRIGRMTRAVAPSGPSVGPRAKTEAKKLGLRPMEHPVASTLLFHHSSSGHSSGYNRISIFKLECKTLSSSQFCDLPTFTKFTFEISRKDLRSKIFVSSTRGRSYIT